MSNTPSTVLVVASTVSHLYKSSSMTDFHRTYSVDGLNAHLTTSMPITQRATSFGLRRPHSNSIGALETLQAGNAAASPISSRSTLPSSSALFRQASAQLPIDFSSHSAITRSKSHMQIELVTSPHAPGLAAPKFAFPQQQSPSRQTSSGSNHSSTSNTPKQLRRSPSEQNRKSTVHEIRASIRHALSSPSIARRHRSALAQLDEEQDDFELVQPLSTDTTCAAFLVRNKRTGKLSVFKPAEGEAYEQQQLQQRQLSYTDTEYDDNEAKRNDSPKQRYLTDSSSNDESNNNSKHRSSADSNQALTRSMSKNVLNDSRLVPLPERVPIKRGVEYGDTAIKEVAAYIMDHGNFASVPRTMAGEVWLARTGTQKQQLLTAGESNEEKRSEQSPNSDEDEPESPRSAVELVAAFGSLQDFKDSIGSAEDLGPSMFDPEDVHRIGILDIRLLNLDRHLGNILVTRNTDDSTNDAKDDGSPSKPSYKLVPIDHGYILPSYRDLSDIHLEWSYWRQCNSPFSQESKDYIARLNPLADAMQLHTLGIRDEALVSMVFSSLLLQRGAAEGLTLAQIAGMIQRSSHAKDEQSALERIVDRVMTKINNLPGNEQSDQPQDGSKESSGPTISVLPTPDLRPASASKLNVNTSLRRPGIEISLVGNTPRPSMFGRSDGERKTGSNKSALTDELDAFILDAQAQSRGEARASISPPPAASNDTSTSSLSPPSSSSTSTIDMSTTPPDNDNSTHDRMHTGSHSPPNHLFDTGISLFSKSPRVQPTFSPLQHIHDLNDRKSPGQHSPPYPMTPEATATRALIMSADLLADEQRMQQLLECTVKEIDSEIASLQRKLAEATNSALNDPAPQYTGQPAHTEPTNMPHSAASPIRNNNAAAQPQLKSPKYVPPHLRRPAHTEKRINSKPINIPQQQFPRKNIRSHRK